MPKKFNKIAILRFLDLVGISPWKIRDLGNILNWIKNRSEFTKLGGLIDRNRFSLSDFSENAGTASGHYFHQDLLVAQYIFRASPSSHLDIGSRIDGFVSHIASFREIQVLDIRPLKTMEHPNIKFMQFDIINDRISQQFDSISCLHSIEHFGLGRYGDKIDPQGHWKAIENIVKLLSESGILYLSFPVSTQKIIEFNSQRIFKYDEINEWCSSYDLKLLNFDLVLDDGTLLKNVDIRQKIEKLDYGCGIYTLQRIKNRSNL
jgi:SAM-dependent methyltransferase